jgi:hypothetical protein
VANLVSYTIPNLIQGISQQPDAQRDPSQGEIQVNAVSSLAEGLRKREGTQAIAKVSNTSFGDVYFHSILRDADEQYLVVISKTVIRVFDLAGNEKTVTAAAGAYNYLSTVVSAKSDIRAASIADYTFISNTQKVPAMSASLAPAIARPAAHEALVWVKAANYGQTYKVNVNGTLATVQTAVAPVIVSGTTTTENRISTEDIATSIQTALAGVSGVTIARKGSVLHFTSSSAITIAASDARANADITAITNSVQAFTELPTIAPAGYQIEVVGDPGNKFDGFYVSFVPRTGAGTFGEGSWQETVSPGVEYQIDATTMPHLLVRLPNGSFWFGPANGSTQSGVQIPSWGERGAGDYDTAPDPSFIGNAIQDVFIYKNRLGFLADENIILSRSRDFFEFFPETVTAVLDSDPIDLTGSNNRVSVLRYAIPYQDELIIFSDQIQFRFNAAETVLTPTTAQITVLTQYEIDPNCRPIPVQGTIIFCQANGQWSQFREFSVRGAGTALVADASDLSGYVNSYVPAEVFKLTANDTGNCWFAVSGKSGYRQRLYAYKYFYRNSGGGAERAQSSWSHWQLSGADKILNALCVQETVYLLVEYGTEVWLEKVSAADRTADVLPNPYQLLLDRRVTTTTATPAAIRVAAGTYNATTNITTWTLPYTIKAKTQAWSDFSATTNGGVLLGEANSGSTITARGNWSTQPIVFGEVFEFLYRFTRFKLYKEVGGGKAAANSERTQVRHAKLRYHDTHYFQVWVTAERREPAVYTFDGTVLAARGSQIGNALNNNPDLVTPRYFEGVFQIPISSRGENCIVELKNSTANPCKFSTCEWVGLVTSQARSLQ